MEASLRDTEKQNKKPKQVLRRENQVEGWKYKGVEKQLLIYKDKQWRQILVLQELGG